MVDLLCLEIIRILQLLLLWFYHLFFFYFGFVHLFYFRWNRFFDLQLTEVYFDHSSISLHLIIFFNQYLWFIWMNENLIYSLLCLKYCLPVEKFDNQILNGCFALIPHTQTRLISMKNIVFFSFAFTFLFVSIFLWLRNLWKCDA